MYVLGLPLQFNYMGIATFVYLGGFAAASGMIIIETIALSIMLSNNIAIPILLHIYKHRDKNYFTGHKIKWVRRISIILILLFAYVYDKYIAQNFALTSIGFVSFVAVAQFFPAILASLYSTTINKRGVLTGILVGFAVWFYTLIIPSVTSTFSVAQYICEKGLWGQSFLLPHALFGLNDLSSISHAFFWSLFFNCSTMIVVSLFTKSDYKEMFQANIFINIYDAVSDESNGVYRGKIFLRDLINVLSNIIGKQRANTLINGYAERHKINVQEDATDIRLQVFAENILASSIGTASADVLIQKISTQNELNLEETLKILQENQKVLISNKELRKKQTDLTKAKEQLQKANELLKSVDVQKDEFLYTVTHELRTPLTSIRAMSEILVDNPDIDDNERMSFLNNIVSETERLSHLITQVLNLEKFESGKQRLNKSSFSFYILALEAIKLVMPIAKKNNISINYILPDSQLMFFGDRDLIMQVLNNLLSNALKFCNAEKGVICLRVIDAQNEIKCIVEDNGLGIEEELHELIFDKFFQAKHQTIKKPVGSGLGLAISKKIILSHNGKIWVESHTHKGSRFIFTLPFE